MNIQDIDLLLSEASRLSNHRHFVLVGSLSILGALVEPPAQMVTSIDVDIYTKFDPGRVFLEIAEKLGEGSDFHIAHGFYADPISPVILSLPEGWQNRLLQTALPSGAVAWCLDPNDAAVSKVIRGEEHDMRWIRAGMECGVLDRETILQRIWTVANAASSGELCAAETRIHDLGDPSCPAMNM